MAKTTKPRESQATEKKKEEKEDAEGEEEISYEEVITPIEEPLAEEAEEISRKELEEAVQRRRLELEKEKGVEWIPRTRLGKMVHSGLIKTMNDVIKTGLPLREPEIVDILLPNMGDEVLDVNLVQRMTDSGRRTRFAITTVVGNMDGYVGIGHAKGKEVGPTIRKAIDRGKLNLIEVRRGCGSWECGCGTPHSLPFVVRGKCGSVEVIFKPAPRGVGLAVGSIAKHVLRLAGVKDVWATTRGQTSTKTNYALAAYDALRKTAEMKISERQDSKLRIISGAISIAG
jgi:small subunit ribosomal protein S5